MEATNTIYSNIIDSNNYNFTRIAYFFPAYLYQISLLIEGIIKTKQTICKYEILKIKTFTRKDFFLDTSNLTILYLYLDINQ